MLYIIIGKLQVSWDCFHHSMTSTRITKFSKVLTIILSRSVIFLYSTMFFI